ncbi:hypothetical protein [Paenibacillus camelliae]|uniref:hypothetical protein n=1 Tax=Paenibacillus camelliae TaxID=512410 RepID=UPI00203BF787|nr:hypothetical protein [Paenibacillus camelliae]
MMLSMICGSVLIGFLQARFQVRTVMFTNMALGIGTSNLLNLQMKSSVATAAEKFGLIWNADPNRDPLNPDIIFR